MVEWVWMLVNRVCYRVKNARCKGERQWQSAFTATEQREAPANHDHAAIMHGPSFTGSDFPADETPSTKRSFGHGFEHYFSQSMTPITASPVLPGSHTTHAAPSSPWQSSLSAQHHVRLL
jgi:hypothetical protein